MSHFGVLVAPQMPIDSQPCSQSIKGNKDIGYGGIDNNGDKDPEVKEFLWDEPSLFEE